MINQGEFLDISLNYSIFMVAFNYTESNSLIAFWYHDVKSFVCEASIIRSIWFDGNSSIICLTFKWIFGYQCLIQSKIYHRRNVSEVWDMIHK